MLSSKMCQDSDLTRAPPICRDVTDVLESALSRSPSVVLLIMALCRFWSPKQLLVPSQVSPNWHELAEPFEKTPCTSSHPYLQHSQRRCRAIAIRFQGVLPPASPTHFSTNEADWGRPSAEAVQLLRIIAGYTRTFRR